ncbi:MAG: 30S ribosomal protein S6 [Holosporales bacterium]|jgi:small subunit ribosomal protein S6|nr:30S ribosomal protein S6 [Holosporales bacterium]
MRRYENVFIARQELAQPQIETLMASFAEIVTGLGGTIARCEYCGLRSLAYKIRNNRKGHYCLLHIEASHEVVKEMERRMRLSEEVLRFMSVVVKTFEDGHCPLTYTRSFREKEDMDKGFQHIEKEINSAEEVVNG